MEGKLSGDSERPAGLGRHVVVADDNRTNLLLLERILKNGGYYPILVPSGEAAVTQVFESDAVACVLLDISMPEMDGIEATKLIRLAESGTSPANRLPILALTADDRRETETSCMSAGANAFLAHPVPPDLLLDMVALLIAERERAASQQSDLDERRSDDLRLDYRGVGERGIKLETIEYLHKVGGPELLDQFSRRLRADSTSAFGYMQLAIDTKDTPAFREQVMNLYSQTASLGSTGIKLVFEHTTKLEPRQLATTGPIVLERLRFEVESLLKVIAAHETAS